MPQPLSRVKSDLAIASLYDEALAEGSHALSLARRQFDQLTLLLPPVRPVRVGVELQPRFAERSPEQAILLKVARQISVTTFLYQALATGNIYEQGILQRISDETFDDVVFLSLGMKNGLNKLHRKFLDAFWTEDFVDEGAGAQFRYTPQVSRKDIRDYIASHAKELGLDGSESASRTIYGVFSGYVHGSVGYILELFDKRTHKFRLAGDFDRAQQLPYLMNAVNYPYRAIMALTYAEQAIRQGSASPNLFAYMDEYESWLDDFLERASEAAAQVSFPVQST